MSLVCVMNYIVWWLCGLCIIGTKAYLNEQEAKPTDPPSDSPNRPKLPEVSTKKDHPTGKSRKRKRDTSATQRYSIILLLLVQS